ncbi:MAG: hypothetical protein ACRDL7_16410, partial [Gaiellaceae bacterium]
MHTSHAFEPLHKVVAVMHSVNETSLIPLAHWVESRDTDELSKIYQAVAGPGSVSLNSGAACPRGIRPGVQDFVIGSAHG